VVMDLLNGMNLPVPVSTKLFEVILTGSMYLRLSVVLSSSVKMGSGEGLRENTTTFNFNHTPSLLHKL